MNICFPQKRPKIAFQMNVDPRKTVLKSYFIDYFVNGNTFDTAVRGENNCTTSWATYVRFTSVFYINVIITTGIIKIIFQYAAFAVKYYVRFNQQFIRFMITFIDLVLQTFIKYLNESRLNKFKFLRFFFFFCFSHSTTCVNISNTIFLELKTYFRRKKFHSRRSFENTHYCFYI